MASAGLAVDPATGINAYNKGMLSKGVTFTV